MIKKMVEQRNLETRGCPDTSFFKDNTAAKIEKNRARSRKAAKEKRKLGAEGMHDLMCQAARPYCHHHKPWWALPGHTLPLPQRRVLYLFWSACFAYVGPFWASVAIFFDPLGPQKYLLITCFEHVKSKSAKTLKTSKNRHNRRNRGINRIINHFNPL